MKTVSQLYEFLGSLGVKYHKDKRLIMEAYRRAKFLNSGESFLGLGFPSEYKSEYFTPSYGRERKRALNWYTLTPKGWSVFSKLMAQNIELTNDHLFSA